MMKGAGERMKNLMPLCIIAAAVISGVICYPSLPDQMVTHWGIDGEPDGYSSKLTALAFTPILMIILVGIFRVVPKTDPKKDNHTTNSGSVQVVENTILLMLLAIHGHIIATGYGYVFPIEKFISILLGVVFIIFGFVMPRLKQNFMIGIRTPWTLSDEEVWRRTHHFGGWVFAIGGFLLVVTAFLPQSNHVFSLIGILIAIVLITVISSYYFYKKVEKGK
jgi:uncharacterized membrane protein